MGKEGRRKRAPIKIMPPKQNSKYVTVDNSSNSTARRSLWDQCVECRQAPGLTNSTDHLICKVVGPSSERRSATKAGLTDPVVAD